MNTQDNSEERKVFEAWAHESAIRTDLGSWEGWKAATQRQQERIAALEAQVQALSLDAGRLDWLTFHLSGKALRDFYAAAYRAGMERAAEICESIAREDYGMTDLHEYGECAEAIRAQMKQNVAIAAGKGEVNG